MTENPDTTVLWDERAIYRVLCRFAEAMDRRAWEMLEEVLVAEATGDFGEGNRVTGRHQFVAMFEHFLGRCGPTQHLIGNIVIDIADDHARSVCYVRDIHQGAGERAQLFFSSPGIYDDRWVRTPEGWRITHRTKTNLMFIGSIGALGSTEQQK